MSLKTDNDYGSIYISKEVIADLAGYSAMECYGLVGMAKRSATSGIVNLLKRENMSKGVKIEETEEGIIIDLYVIIQFGTKISVVAENIIDKVKYNVENQLNIKVKEVKINIESVRVGE